jgi:Flp pilus assembly protein protease CpaA
MLAGGDVKLILSFLPAIDGNNYMYWLCTIGLFGGGCVLILFLHGRMYKIPSSKIFERGVPYGVPITLSSLMFLCTVD